MTRTWEILFALPSTGEGLVIIEACTEALPIKDSLELRESGRCVLDVEPTFRHDSITQRLIFVTRSDEVESAEGYAGQVVDDNGYELHVVLVPLGSEQEYLGRR